MSKKVYERAIENAKNHYADLFEQGVELLKRRDRLMRNTKVREFIEVDREWRALLERTNGAAHTLGALVGGQTADERRSRRTRGRRTERRRVTAR